MKKLANLTGVKILSKNQQRFINGGDLYEVCAALGQYECIDINSGTYFCSVTDQTGIDFECWETSGC